ncbi:MAG: hypothetical protein LC632_05050 [Xanthomonadaceae bacterium]|nr:hypothetical protein [Xanthomonadaceae bacterium]
MSPRTIRVLVIAWSSFLPAGVAAVVFFAAFDPTAIAREATFPMELSPLTGYAIGFLGFWTMTAAAAWMATFLISRN